MSSDRRHDTPEPRVGSGGDTSSGAGSEESSAPGAGNAMRPAPAADAPPNPGPDAAMPAGEPEAPVGPVTTPSSEESEAGPEAADVDVEVAALMAKAAKADEYLDLAQRTRAEFENYRRRATKEAAAAQVRGADKLARELLPAIDNLDRALAHARSAENGDGEASLLAGIKHVHSDVLAALKRAGIEPFSPEGEPFDPQYHEAVAQTPQEGAEPGTVLEVYQRGYRRGESILRPARVVVAG
jgi:molecular chaperone GrpE